MLDSSDSTPGASSKVDSSVAGKFIVPVLSLFYLFLRLKFNVYISTSTTVLEVNHLTCATNPHS